MWVSQCRKGKEREERQCPSYHLFVQEHNNGRPQATAQIYLPSHLSRIRILTLLFEPPATETDVFC